MSLNGQPISSSRELTRLIGLREPGEIANLEVRRDGKEQSVEVKLGERPDLERVAQQRELPASPGW